MWDTTSKINSYGSYVLNEFFNSYRGISYIL